MVLCTLAGCGESPARPIPLPEGKSFALAFIDESDKASLAAVRPVYDAFIAAGFRPTLAVWTHRPRFDHTQDGPFDEARTPGHGVSLEDEAWREYLRQLNLRGFEIASHSASSGDDPREMMKDSFENHLAWFGHAPRIFTPHHYNLETPYSTGDLWSFPFSMMVNWTVGRASEGSRTNSPYRWDDSFRRYILYAKGWGVWGLNTFARMPGMPARPTGSAEGPAWFACTNGYAPSRLPELFSEVQFEKLAREKGVAILCTHFSSFTEKMPSGNYVLRPFARDLIDWLSRHPDAWVAPAGEVLDALARQSGRHPPTWREQSGLFSDGLRNYLFLNKPWTRRYLSTPGGS
ncbi:MAG: hypothetical protein HYT87_01975 [Nitrospirae bacterium]|nr:hypothetical protein [Nitrospirota bacterium]